MTKKKDCESLQKAANQCRKNKKDKKDEEDKDDEDDQNKTDDRTTKWNTRFEG